MQEYISVLKRIFYKQGSVRKFNEKDFMKEIRGAFAYSQLVFCQRLLMEIKEGKLTKDELYGELQIGLKDAYDNYKRDCNLLKIPSLNFDEFFLGDK
jgi:hypothetical protein